MSGMFHDAMQQMMQCFQYVVAAGSSKDVQLNSISDQAREISANHNLIISWYQMWILAGM